MANLVVIPFTYELFFRYQIYNNGCLCSWESPLTAGHRSTFTHLLNAQLPVYRWPDFVHWPQSTHGRPYFLTLDGRLHIVLHIRYFRDGALKAQIQELVASKSLHSPANIANLERCSVRSQEHRFRSQTAWYSPAHSLLLCLWTWASDLWLLNVSVSS